MPDAEIQYISNERGEPTAVIVPISLWREIESERETVVGTPKGKMKAWHEATLPGSPSGQSYSSILAL
jgi:hypothetical protein